MKTLTVSLVSLMLSAPLFAAETKTEAKAEAKTSAAEADIKKAAKSTKDAVVTTFEETKTTVGTKVDAGAEVVKDKFHEVKTDVQSATETGVAKTKKAAKTVAQTVKAGVVKATDAVLGTGAEVKVDAKVEEKK